MTEACAWSADSARHSRRLFPGSMFRPTLNFPPHLLSESFTTIALETLRAVINKPNAGVSAVTKGSAGDLPTNI